MRAPLFRAAALAAVTLVALPTAAAAAVDEYAAKAATTAVHLAVFEDQVGSPVLDLVGTDAMGSSDPMASASVSAISVLGESVGDVRTASSDRERVRDPESGDGCAASPTAPGLTLDVVCAIARARAGHPGDTGNQDATADTVLTNVDIDGSLLAALLTSGLDSFLDDLSGDLADGAVAAAIAAFTEECNAFLEMVTNPLAPGVTTVAELLDQSPAELEAADTVLSAISGSSPCTAIIGLSTQDLTQDVVDVAPLAEALAGVDLIQIIVNGATSNIAGTDTTMSARADQVFVSVTGPSLAFLDDVIEAIVQGMYDGFIAEIETIAGQDLPDDFDISDELAAALDQIPLFGITDPLLTAVVSGGSATAELDLGDGDSAGGGDKPFVTVGIAAGLVELLGGDPSMASLTLAAGESGTIGEGTPLESTVSVGTLTIDDDATFEDSALSGSRATASATDVSLLSGVEGGIGLVLAESTAGVFGAEAGSTAGSSDPDDDDADPLPNTGGGAALTALAVLGAALLLRRRTTA